MYIYVLVAGSCNKLSIYPIVLIVICYDSSEIVLREVIPQDFYKSYSSSCITFSFSVTNFETMAG